MAMALRAAELTKKELAVDRKLLSSTRRKAICALDARMTSRNIGYVGVAFVTLVVVVIILPDITTMISHALHGVPVQRFKRRRRVFPVL
jgi:hypothetical protein